MRHAIHRAQRGANAKAALVAANRNPLTAAIAPLYQVGRSLSYWVNV